MTAFANDTELIAALKQNIPGAFDQVYESYYRPLCYFAEKLSGDRATAEDLASETFIKLLQKNTNFENIVALRSFLYTVTRNACLDHIKMQNRHQASHEEMRLRANEEEQTIEHSIIKSEVLRAIYTAIEQLPEKYKDIVHGALIEGKKTDEMANALNLAPQTVKNRKAEGLKLLRLALLKNETLSPLVLCYVLMHIS